jgi:hypothetical protein
MHGIGVDASRALPSGAVNRVILVALGAAALLGACGGEPAGDGNGAGGVGGAPPVARPALARPPERAGEVVVQGEASPASHGPFLLHGRYTARFEQVAPEDPDLDFGAQNAFVATLDRRAEQEGGDSIRLFRAAARTGRRTVTVRGRYFIDVSFGDFPYAIRLTPLPRR